MDKAIKTPINLLLFLRLVTHQILMLNLPKKQVDQIKGDKVKTVEFEKNNTCSHETRHTVVVLGLV